MKRFLRHPVFRNALALYSLQFAEYLVPMITIPYLARVLQPASWGMVVYAQNFSGWLGLVLQYGFGFSATREIARQRDEPGRHADVVRGVLGADIFLLAPILVIGIVARFAVPEFHRRPGFLWLALLMTVAQGLRPFWYFQGLETMTFPAWLNVGGRCLNALGIFWLVKSPDDGWIVLALQTLAGAAISLVIVGEMYRKVSFRWPTVEASIAALKSGWTIFLSSSASSLYTLANTFILGLFADSTQVAYYGGAERIIMIASGLMGPFSQALYPRMSHLAASNRGSAAQVARWSLLFLVTGGLAMGLAIFAAAPLIVRVLLGRSYYPAIGVLRVSAPILPVVAVTNILGMQWMLPFGLDRMFNRIVVSAGILNVILASILSLRFGPIGTASAVLVSQCFVAVSMCVSLIRSGHRFWGETQAAVAVDSGIQP